MSNKKIIFFSREKLWYITWMCYRNVLPLQERLRTHKAFTVEQIITEILL